jgi:hypothetical protein
VRRDYSPLVSIVCKNIGVSMPEAEVRFAPPRRWRFDFAWIDEKVALEIQGGVFTHGRHTRGGALLKEHEKLNAAAAAGWKVLYCTPKNLVQMGPVIREALKVPA